MFRTACSWMGTAAAVVLLTHAAANGSAAWSGARDGALTPLQAKTEEEMRRKAGGLVLKQVKFEGVSLTEAVATLVRDAQQEDPDRRGVPIVIVAPKEVEEIEVHLSLSNVPLTEATRYVGQLAGLEMRITGGGLELVLPSAE